MTQQKLDVVDFEGVVVMRDWIDGPDGGLYRLVRGVVSIMHDTETVGFKVNDRESNWIARVQSRDRKTALNILGCQIRAVYSFEDRKQSFHSAHLLDMDAVASGARARGV